jgi:hypothetical protein
LRLRRGDQIKRERGAQQQVADQSLHERFLVLRFSTTWLLSAVIGSRLS